MIGVSLGQGLQMLRAMPTSCLQCLGLGFSLPSSSPSCSCALWDSIGVRSCIRVAATHLEDTN